MSRNLRSKRKINDQQNDVANTKYQSSAESHASTSTSSNKKNLWNTENTIFTPFNIPYASKAIPCILFGAPTENLAMIFTQGAGGTLSAHAVQNFAKGFSERKRLLCFQGNMNIQSRIKMFKAVIEHENGCNVLSGRSMGARAAILTSQDIDNVKALVLVSYPLENNGKVRDQLLLNIREGMDVLFVSGDRDSMCDINDLRRVIQKMKTNTWLVVVKEANHGMQMRPKKATEAVGIMTGKIVAEWLSERNEKLTKCEVYWNEDENKVVVSDWMGL